MTPLRAILLAAAVLLGLAPGAAVAAPASLVMDARSGAVLQESEGAHRWHPASLTKLMTVFLALEAVEEGRLSLGETLVVSPSAAAVSEFKLGLRSGASIRAREAILAVLQRSANDAAVVLAERLAGNEAAFAARMTAKARALGMSGTRFRNATGLPDAEQVTTARDMALLARATLERFPQHADLFTAPGLSYGGRSWPTINALLTSYPGAEAVKTGFTCGSGYNVVASARRGGRRLIAVVLGAKTGAERNALAARLLSAGFASQATSSRSIADLAQPVSTPPLVLGPGECVASRGSRASSGSAAGWAMLLGTFASQPQAQQAIDAARAQIASRMRGGRALVTPREREGARGWTAAIGGLSRPEASAACKQLWEEDVFCRPLLRTQLASEKVRRLR